MLAYIRDLASAEAQRCLRQASLTYARTGIWDRREEDRYRAAERIVDACDRALAMERALLPDIPLADVEPMTESELRALYGDR